MEETTSEVIGDLLHFLKIMALICGVSVVFALGIAYGLHVIKDSPLSETFIAVLGGLSILLMITGALGAANAPAKTLSRGETSRTHIQEMKKMRSLSNPLFAPGLSVFLSGGYFGFSCVFFEVMRESKRLKPKRYNLLNHNGNKFKFLENVNMNNNLLNIQK